METMQPARGPTPTSDPGNKRPRSFQCRDALWDSLTAVATELECTVDFLLNDAIKHYLRHRQRATQPIPAAPPIPAALPIPMAPPIPAPVERPTPAGHAHTPSSQRRLAPPPPLPQPIFAPPPGFAPPPMAPPPMAPPPFAPPPLPPRPAPPIPHPPWPPSMIGAPRPPLPPPFAPPIPPPAPRPMPPPPPLPMAPRARPRLLVSYADRSVEVERPGFIIGRGKQAAGLTIKDPNISRTHATIEQHEGVYYLVDMGSTNGTLVNGLPIQRRPIADGDVARICDHEIRFSLR